MVSVSKCLWIEDVVANNVCFEWMFIMLSLFIWMHFIHVEAFEFENHRNESWLNGPNNNFNIMLTHFRYRAASQTYWFAFQDRQQNVHIFGKLIAYSCQTNEWMNVTTPFELLWTSSFSALNNIYNNQNNTSTVEIVSPVVCLSFRMRSYWPLTVLRSRSILLLKIRMDMSVNVYCLLFPNVHGLSEWILFR